jgi:hypothetical protein
LSESLRRLLRQIVADAARDGPVLALPLSQSLHNYRWRLGLAEGDTKYDDLERTRLQV